MEHGVDIRSEGQQLHRRHQAVRRVLLLGNVHHRHSRDDGGSICFLAHPAFALVSLQNSKQARKEVTDKIFLN